ncbi:unnamed protein product [Chrysoparadoxa australica]
MTKKPWVLPLPHPLVANNGCEMCLFVKGDSKKAIKELLEEHPVQGMNMVITLDQLRTEYKEFKHRRELLNSFDLFLCDERILPMMTKTLGKTFMSARKQPVAVNVTRQHSLPSVIAAARDGTVLRASSGVCWDVKAATTAMSVDEIVSNLEASVPAAVDKIPGKWSNVQIIHLKVRDSPGLPIYASVVEAGKGGAADANSGVNAAGEDIEDDGKKCKVKSKKLREQLNGVAKQLKQKDLEDQQETPKGKKLRKTGTVEGEQEGDAGKKTGKRKAKELPQAAEVKATPKSSKKAKAAVVEQPEEEPQEVEVPAPKSVKKKAKTPAKQAAEVKATPKSSKMAKAAVVEQPEEEEEEVEVPAPKSAKKKAETPAKQAAEVKATPKSSKKAKAAVVEQPQEEEEVEVPAPKSAKKKAKTPAKPEAKATLRKAKQTPSKEDSTTRGLASMSKTPQPKSRKLKAAKRRKSTGVA